ncbi:hypothetical protein J7E97_16060 [Streptomyces sp. ISL-66]|uniref:hypothetical protein n=1 Tax=Streptomyces sp. ISL-66 TaxID=2819186 RepID=UPI001BE99074|nr:hypothetical protein [Streptomyces sp. ISL-66]MBT2469349.1 hypothetical protein [Streptomyces sp. ISL-66]
MGSDSAQVEKTAAAVVRALRAWPEVTVGDVSDPVPNRRGTGCRIYVEVLAIGVDDSFEVTVERADGGPAQRAALPAGRALRSRRR